MKCYEPSEQYFDLKDMAIGIDWGQNGDKSVQVKALKQKDGTIKILEIKELVKP